MCVQREKKNENMEFNDFSHCEKIAKIDDINNTEMKKLQIWGKKLDKISLKLKLKAENPQSVSIVCQNI